MHASTIAAAALLVFAAPAAAQPEDYRAAGTEPFWSLTIGAETMRFEAPDRPTVTVATPKVIHGFAGEMWQTRRIGVNTIHKACKDDMRDRVFPDTVEVRVDGRAYQGCGGGDVPFDAPRTAVDGAWRIQLLGGKPPVRGSDLTVSFVAGRITGNSGCNRFNGAYSFAGGRLTAGPLASTRRACIDPRTQAQERALLDLLGKRLTVSSNRRGKLVLTARGGKTLTLVRGG